MKDLTDEQIANAMTHFRELLISLGMTPRPRVVPTEEKMKIVGEILTEVIREKQVEALAMEHPARKPMRQRITELIDQYEWRASQYRLATGSVPPEMAARMRDEADHLREIAAELKEMIAESGDKKCKFRELTLGRNFHFLGHRWKKVSESRATMLGCIEEDFTVALDTFVQPE